MSDSKEHNADSPQPRGHTEEWVRERLVTRLYEPLPPEEEAEVEAYLQAHPELRDCGKKYQEIAGRIGELESFEDPLADEEVHAFVSALQYRTGRSHVRMRSRVVRWLAAAAVAASVLALIFTKGLTVQVGETRITLGRVAATSTFDDEQSRERMMKEVATVLNSYLDALEEQAVSQNRRIETIYQVLSYQRGIDRQEMRNTIQKLVDQIGIMPRGKVAYANPLFRTGDNPDTENAMVEQ